MKQQRKLDIDFFFWLCIATVQRYVGLFGGDWYLSFTACKVTKGVYGIVSWFTKLGNWPVSGILKFRGLFASTI